MLLVPSFSLSILIGGLTPMAENNSQEPSNFNWTVKSVLNSISFYLDSVIDKLIFETVR